MPPRPRGRAPQIVTHAILISGGLLAGALLAEGLARLVLDPVDYLAVTPVPDSILGFRLKPFTSGHDAWGFRNRKVPDRAEIVTIGDSQTYGYGAPARLSWPHQLGRLTGRSTYDLSLAGYSPVQYHRLLETHAFRLKPSVVIVGFYFGNDLYDAQNVVYGLDYWRPLRRAGLTERKYEGLVHQPRGVALEGVRHWLARHSVAYRLVTFSTIGTLVQKAERRAELPFVHPVHTATTALTPGVRLKGLDFGNEYIREGLRISLDRLGRMAEQCRAAGVHLLVVLIPTKERVHEPWFDSLLSRHVTLQRMLRGERHGVDQVKTFLEAQSIPYLDLTPAMQEAAEQGTIYPPHEDGHPNRHGYAAIAAAVAERIRPWIAEK